MSDALDFMQVATSGATALVAEMTKNGWDTFRNAIARLFGQGSAAEEELQLIDEARTRLTESPEGERASVAKALEQELLMQLYTFLRKKPEAAAELQALVDQLEQPEAGSGAGVRADVRDNTGSQVLIAGRDVSAGDFTYGTPQGEK